MPVQSCVDIHKWIRQPICWLVGLLVQCGPIGPQYYQSFYFILARDLVCGWIYISCERTSVFVSQKCDFNCSMIWFWPAARLTFSLGAPYSSHHPCNCHGAVSMLPCKQSSTPWKSLHYRVFYFFAGSSFLRRVFYFLANVIFIACSGSILKPCNVSLPTEACVASWNSTNAMSWRPGTRRTSR